MKAGTQAERTGPRHATEWESAELVERFELLESRVKALQEERERLRTELRIAQLWVKELALWLDEALARKGVRALQPPGLALAPETLTVLREENERALPWARLATLGALVTAPWAMIALLVWLLWFVV